MKATNEKPKGWIIGLEVSDEVWVVRDGKKVVVARYDKRGRRGGDDRAQKLAVPLSH